MVSSISSRGKVALRRPGGGAVGMARRHGPVVVGHLATTLTDGVTRAVGQLQRALLE